jgi:DNA-binding XRE family transcriptional regulator
MNPRIDYQTIEHNGEATHAVVPYAQFMDLLKLAQNEPTIPHEVVSMIVDGVSPVRAWREHLKISQQDMADRLSVTQPTYQAKEKLGANFRKKTSEQLAEALGITLEQLNI